MSRIAGLRWDGWPDPDDVLLLTALLHLDHQTASAAWKEFRSHWDPDAPTGEQFFLFPLLAERLALLDAQDPLIGMLQGVRRHLTVRAMMLLNDVAQAFDLLEQSGIDPVLLKGPALVLTVYDHVGQRPSSDVDLLVHPTEFDKAGDALIRAGWEKGDDFPGNHAVAFKRGDFEIDLHRQPHPELVVPGRLDDTMSILQTVPAIRPLPSGRIVGVFAPTDALLHTLVHGTQRLLPHLLRWAVDADRLISTGGIDWQRLVDLASQFKVAPVVHDALKFLSDVTGREVPSWVLAKLAAVRVSRFDRVRLSSFHEWQRTDGRLGNLPATASWFLWKTRDRNLLGVLAAAPSYFSEYWKLQSLWQLPGAVVRGALRVRSRS